MTLVDHEPLTRGFFRGVNSTPLCRRFFDSFGVWEGMGLNDESRPDQIYAAWSKLDRGTHPELDQAIRRVNDLGREKARWAMIYRARDLGVADWDALTPQKLSITLFIEHRSAFEEIYSHYTIEKTERLDILIGRFPVRCEPSTEVLDRFKKELAGVLKRSAHGDRLQIDPGAPHPKKWMVAVPHETQPRTHLEFDENDEITQKDSRPIYEMVLIYYHGNGVLKVKAGRGKRKSHDVAACFATHVLGQDPLHFRHCDVVDFNALRDPDFSFTPAPEDHFKWVRPTRVKFRKRATAEASWDVQYKDDAAGGMSVLEYLATQGIALREIDVESMTLRFMFKRSDRDFRDVTLTAPDDCTLDDTPVDRFVERTLVRWRLLDPHAKERLSRVGPS